jgi:peptidoglycan/LPS O-acetylase OafA/YrhL
MKFLGHFSRITSGRALIPQIDGLRFIAIMAVVAYHVRQICSYYLPASPTRTAVQGDLVNDIFSVGNFGVALFFCLSGFILSLPFARQHLCSGKEINLREYFVRRVTRIEPPYIIHLIFLFALCALVLRHESTHQVFYQNENWAGYSLKHILASLIYMNGVIYGAHPYPNIVLWSLEVEVQFYLLAPFLARVFMIKGNWMRRGLLAGSLILFMFASPHLAGLCRNPYRIVFSLAGNLQYFLVGFLLADFYLSGWLTAPARNLKWDFLFFLTFAIAVYFRLSPWLGVMLPFLMLICCTGAFRGKAAFQFLGYPWITTIGGMCYTIYMYHTLIISSFARLTCRWRTHILWLDLLIQFIILSAAIIVLCAILFAFLERPFMRKNWPATVWSAVRLGRKAAKATTMIQ